MQLNDADWTSAVLEPSQPSSRDMESANAVELVPADHDHNHEQSQRQTNAARQSKERPCDACRRRKTRCVKEENQDKCVLCKFHAQECTFLHQPVARNRKRKASVDLPKRLKASSRQTDHNGIEEYDEYHGQTILRKTLGLMNKHHAHLVGSTEPFSFPRFSFPIGSSQRIVQGGNVTIRKVAPETLFTINEDQGTVGYDTENGRRDAVQEIIGPHGPDLVDLYFRVVHPSFPILHKGVWIEKYERSLNEFTAASLGAVYLLASTYWAYSPKLSDFPKPDMAKIWRISLESFDYTIFRPKLSSVQSGLLLAQYESTDGGVVSNGSRGKLTAHLISIAHKVGLHMDAALWDIPVWEVGLRRRLAWALFMQDKWVALVEGRPALLSHLNWSVDMCHEQDFPEFQEHEEEGSSEVQKGRIMFIQMVALTQILSDLLDTVFSLRAHQDIQRSPDPLRRLLEVVQPLQLRLKNWYASTRETLRMDNAIAMKLSSTGYLRLAYLVLEVSIHHRIICQTCNGDADPNLLQICRLAARDRFLSALDFVNSLKAQHLSSFWYFSSSPSFTILISFGNLLLSSAFDPEEKQFYLTKLKEFRWTLKVNGEAGAKFIKPALAAMVDPDELCRRQPNELWAGGSPATTVSKASHVFTPPNTGGLDTSVYGGITPAGPTLSTSWSGASPIYQDLGNAPIPDMQEYLNAFAWVPPTFGDDQLHSFNGG